MKKIKGMFIIFSAIIVLVALGLFVIYKIGFMGKLWNPELRKVVNAVKNNFVQLKYTNEENGITLKYNLFVPENYDQNKKYPLVVFIHDSSVTGNNTTATLTQGYGAVIWALEKEQKKHECFILAPQFEKTIANDNFELAPEGLETINLLNLIVNGYNIDKDRLYITGQSMGCMTAMALNIKYQNLFAASIYVAGQWDSQNMQEFVNDNIFYLVSEGDEKASPGMQTMETFLKKEGAQISYAIWDGKWTSEEFDSAVKAIVSEGNHINFVRFRKGTVIPKGTKSSPMLEHIYTWDVAYTIEGVRDWLFEQVNEK
jgi:predicted peptidase